MKKLFFFPSESLAGYTNPYCNNYKEAMQRYFAVLDTERGSKFKRMFTLLFYSFRSDIIIFNWLESVPFFRMGKVQFFIDWLALCVIKIRGVKVLFMHHDLTSHFGNNWMSRYLFRWLFKNADLIISHSQEAAAVAKQRSAAPSYYYPHPLKRLSVAPQVVKPADVFIWGNMLGYKGIVEFLSLPAMQQSQLSIYILGRAKDERLRESIQAFCNDHIVFEERRAEMDEVAAYCRGSKYVLFPYVGDSISSSGALIDTLVLGGTPVGPNRGAFKDLNEEGLCLVYDTYQELFALLKSEVSIDNSKLETYVDRYSWEDFSSFLNEKLKKCS